MTPAGSIGATIRLFLVDGTPQGIRLVDRSQWTGVCLAFARADYARARLRGEFGRTGVYLLSGPEARLINIANTVGAVRLDNGTSPDVPWLSEPEVSDMESYLAYMLVILPTVGVHAFELPITTDPSGETGASGTPAPRKKYFLKNQLTTAEGTDDSRGFTVFAGALGRREPAAMSQGYLSLRTKLLAEGVLVEHGQDQIRLARTYAFDSPSSAASVLSGGSKNGRIEWRDSEGRTLRDNQQDTAETSVNGAPGRTDLIRDDQATTGKATFRP